MCFDADAAARNTVLFSRLTPVWQDEEALLDGLRQPVRQWWIVTQSSAVERRRLILPKVRWQLRLALLDRSSASVEGETA